MKEGVGHAQRGEEVASSTGRGGGAGKLLTQLPGGEVLRIKHLDLQNRYWGSPGTESPP